MFRNVIALPITIRATGEGRVLVSARERGTRVGFCGSVDFALIWTLSPGGGTLSRDFVGTPYHLADAE